MYYFHLIILALLIVALSSISKADNSYDVSAPPVPPSYKEQRIAYHRLILGGPYTYSQSLHSFIGLAYDQISMVNTTGVCSGKLGVHRNNALSQCEIGNGPLPQGNYTISNMIMECKGMRYCYALYPASTNNMCGRSGFLIRGGYCRDDVSDGSIVIESDTARYLIKAGATLVVVP